MIKLLGSILKSSTTASVIKGGHAGLTKAAPSVAFGGSVVAGVVSMIVSGYKIADCIRYQTGPGQCDAVIETNLPGAIAGGGVLAGCWGAFNTYNPKLHREDQAIILPAKELVTETEEPTFSLALVKSMKEEGATQQEIADSLGVSRYTVQKALKKIKAEERGR
jgi:hypothetical protein